MCFSSYLVFYALNMHWKAVKVILISYDLISYACVTMLHMEKGVCCVLLLKCLARLIL